MSDGEGTSPVESDWTHRGDYIRTRSGRKESAGETNIEPEWANEAFADDTLWGANAWKSNDVDQRH